MRRLIKLLLCAARLVALLLDVRGDRAQNRRLLLTCKRARDQIKLPNNDHSTRHGALDISWNGKFVNAVAVMRRVAHLPGGMSVLELLIQCKYNLWRESGYVRSSKPGNVVHLFFNYYKNKNKNKNCSL